jgi:hypothetical protein
LVVAGDSTEEVDSPALELVVRARVVADVGDTTDEVGPADIGWLF